MDYRNYSLKQLDEWIHDVMHSDDITPQEIYDTIVKCVEEDIDYHRDRLDRAVGFLSLLKGESNVGICSLTDDSDCNEPIVLTNREYNLREANYYDMRAKLDAEHNNKFPKVENKDWDDFWNDVESQNFEKILKEEGYEYTPPTYPDRY